MTTFAFEGTFAILPWSHRDMASALHSAGAGKHKLLHKTPASRIPHQEPTACPLTHRLQGLIWICKSPGDWAWLGPETTFLLRHHSSTHLQFKAREKAFSDIFSLQLVPDTLGWLLFRAHCRVSSTRAWQVPGEQVYYKVTGLIYAIWVMIRGLK